MRALRWQQRGAALAVAVAATLCGCAGMSPFGGGPEPLYKVDNRSGGFTISTVHVQRASMPRDAVEQACRQGLVRNANDLARSLGRSIQPVDARAASVRLSTDGPAGVTRCEGSLPATWAR